MTTRTDVAESETICVVGLGHIGLPTAVLLADNGHHIRGVDTNAEIVTSVNAGHPPFSEPKLPPLLKKAIICGRLSATTKPVPADIFIITVPTPLTDAKEADLSFLWSAVRSIAPVLSGSELIVVESTSPPGTTDAVAQEITRMRPDLTLHPNQPNSLYFAHCPERVIPGKTMVEMIENDRIIGGLNDESSKRAVALYSSFSRGELYTTDSMTAELVKLSENSFRDVNIAFANELSLICQRLDLNVWEVIELANRHPRVNILQPGPGVGGHCIAVDPWFIHDAAPEEAKLIKTARLVNDSKPKYVVDRVVQLVNGDPETTVCALGLTFKADIDDVRESPSVKIVNALAAGLPQNKVLVSDPHVRALPSQLADRENVSLVQTETGVAEADLILLLVDHKEFRALAPARIAGKTIVDTKGIWS